MNEEATQAATIAVIGDVHLLWDDADVSFFNRGGYDLLLFVGDLAGYTQVRGRRSHPEHTAFETCFAKVRPVAVQASSAHSAMFSFSDTADAASRLPEFL